jgi:Pre-toxin TG
MGYEDLDLIFGGRGTGMPSTDKVDAVIEWVNDPNRDYLADADALVDIERAQHALDRGTGGYRLKLLGSKLAHKAASWADLQDLIRKNVYDRRIVDNQQDAKALIAATVEAYDKLYPGTDPDQVWEVSFVLEKEYEKESRRQRVAEIAQGLKQKEDAEYEQFLLELNYIRGLPQSEETERFIRVETGDIISPTFRASGVVEPIYDFLNAAAPYVSFALDFVPFVGQVKGIAEAVIGRDLITGDEIPNWARGLSGALGFTPFAKLSFRAVKTSVRIAGGGASAGLKHLAALAYHVTGKIDPRTLFRVTKAWSKVSKKVEESLEVASHISAGKALTSAERAAVKEVSQAFEVLEAESRLSRTASGVIDKGRVVTRSESGTIVQKAAATTAKVVTKKVSKAAQRLISKGYRPEAIEALESLGVKVTRKLADQLEKLDTTGRDFLNLFHKSKGFQRVVSDLTKGANKAEGAAFVMLVATQHPNILNQVRVDPLLIAFEWGAGIKKTRRFGDIFAREVDIVVRGERTLEMEETVYNELKNWSLKSLRAAKNKKIPQQFVRDLATLDPKNIRWIFNGEKIKDKGKIIDVFVEIIKKDAYLTKTWGTDIEKIRQDLERVIQLVEKGEKGLIFR